MRFVKMKNSITLKESAKKLPFNPGVYLMKNENGEIIYIGKAKNLKNRVLSYFMSDSNHSEKVKKMVKNVHHFDYIVTDSEFEALVLECSLIKKHLPKYNILLKDDKGYSYIKITNEKWPRVSYVKQKENDGALYIGPYTNSFSVKKTVEEAIKIFKIPTCGRNFNKLSKSACLNYYIGRCSAPCIGAIDNYSYNLVINDVIKFLKNGSAEVIKYFTEKMKKASENMNFEQAAEYRDKIKAIQNVNSKQKVVSYKVDEQDVIACAGDGKHTAFEIFRFSGGDLYENQSYLVESQDDEISTRTEFIKSYYEMKEKVPKRIVIDGKLENAELIKKYLSQKVGKSVNILIPEKGDQFQLVNMCKNNAYEYLLRSKEYKTRQEDILEDIKNILSLSVSPKYIEAYDISNLRNSNNVGAMVVFKDAKPFKKAYRKFKIKNVTIQDDYGSMKEMLERRFENYHNNEDDPAFSVLPDLILIDGGKSHTTAAKEIIQKFSLNIPVFGMVKDSKHRTRAITTEGAEIEIKNSSRVFGFITKVQEEVHRFTINYHRKLRGKSVRTSELTNIEGIGKVKANALLKSFGSIDAVKNASEAELLKIKGITKKNVENIKKYYFIAT